MPRFYIPSKGKFNTIIFVYMLQINWSCFGLEDCCIKFKINQVFYSFNTRELSVNRKDLRASTLVGLTWENPTLDPLTVPHRNNRLCSTTKYIKHNKVWSSTTCKVQNRFWASKLHKIYMHESLREREGKVGRPKLEYQKCTNYFNWSRHASTSNENH